jgi:hypothetical protein
VQGALRIRFSQGTLQTIELRGRILRPLLVLAPSHLKFGAVHCKAFETVSLFLSNPTKVDAHFKVRHVPQLTKYANRSMSKQGHDATNPIKRDDDDVHDDPGVFRLSIMSGTLSGPTLPLHTSGGFAPSLCPGYVGSVREPLQVLVTFAPAKPQAYKCRFRFDVEYGDGFDVVLEGHGTLDEEKTTRISRSIPRANPLRHSHFMFGPVAE